MKLPWTFEYASLSVSDVLEDSEKAENVGFLEICRGHGIICRSKRPSGLMIIVTIMNLAILVLSFTLFVSRQDTGRNSILKKSSFYSPILDRFDLPTFVRKINGTLFLPKKPSIARQDPNPEADAIWDELELIRTLIISGEEVKKLGKDPNTAAKFDDKYWGFGDDAYMAQIDVFHQLHCLNELRKLAYPDYYSFFPNTSSSHSHHHTRSTYSKLWKVHIGHCVDILMQNIMCNANTDLITLQWMKTQDNPFPDFSINHQCRDFDALVEWRKTESVDVEKWNRMKKPIGVKEVEVEDGYWELFGSESDDGEH